MPVSEMVSDVVPGAVPIANRLQAGFERRVAELVAAARRVRAEADPGAIHDLRVAARRMLSALRVWRGLAPTRERRASTRELRRLRRRVGKAREHEVLIELLESRLAGLDDATRAAAGAVLEHMQERLARVRRRAASRVRPKRVKRLHKLLESLAGGVGIRFLGDSNAIDAALGVEREAAAGARTALGSAREGHNDDALHEARIAAKKWRYAIECVEEAVPGAPSRRLEQLRAIQEVLGVIHDHGLLRDSLRQSGRDVEPAVKPGALEPLIHGLEVERRRALLLFQRLTGALSEATDMSGAARPAQPTGSEAPAGGERREERWDRIARWLANAADAPAEKRAAPPTTSATTDLGPPKEFAGGS